MPIRPRLSFLDVAFDPIEMPEALDLLEKRRADDPFAFVVTPNVDHIVRLNREEDAGGPLARAYREAWLCLCDSRVLRRLARHYGVTLTVVPGSDLTARLLDQIEAGERVTVIGGSSSLSKALAATYPHIDVRSHVPPMGLATNPTAIDACADVIVTTGSRYTFLAVGSPQQELVALATASRPEARGTALCIGASLEFLTGDQVRAPGWMQRAGLEWLHRLVANPGRMWRRYLIDDPKIFLMARRWAASRKRSVAP
jgi:exopolysaccharide biosynthesis WecB/TagA/CpsF family protein